MSDAVTDPATTTDPVTTDPAAVTDPAKTDPTVQADKGPLDRGNVDPPADPNAAQDWFKALPEDLQKDNSLANFSSKPIEELAKGYVETKRVATSKVTLPKDDDPESFDRFAAAVRPEDPAAYTIDLGDGEDSSFADHMRGVFHQAGLHPKQVELVVAANNDFVKEATAAFDAKGRAEMDALEAEMGKSEFARSKQAAVNMLNRLGIDPKFDSDMARMIGAGSTLRTLFALAERTGELGRVDGTDVQLALGTLTGDAAMTAAREMQKDPQIAAKLNDANSPERKRYDELVQNAAKKG